jgi:hypothetical protein
MAHQSNAPFGNRGCGIPSWVPPQVSRIERAQWRPWLPRRQAQRKSRELRELSVETLGTEEMHDPVATVEEMTCPEWELYSGGGAHGVPLRRERQCANGEAMGFDPRRL